jgi:hypothetical protein
MSAPSAFEAIRQSQQIARTLGDVSLRYEPSMLIGETARPTRSWQTTLAWAAGFSALVVTLGLFLVNAPFAALVVVTAFSAGALLYANFLAERDRRRRAFIVNFETYSLRLDFTTPFAGRPKTMVVHFDGVRGVELLEQGGGLFCLTVDFVPAPGASTVLREALAANIPGAQKDDAERLQRVLQGAFGLGAPPPVEDGPPPEP